MRKVDLGIQYLGYLFVVGKLSSVIRSDRMNMFLIWHQERYRRSGYILCRF